MAENMLYNSQMSLDGLGFLKKVLNYPVSLENLILPLKTYFYKCIYHASKNIKHCVLCHFICSNLNEYF